MVRMTEEERARAVGMIQAGTHLRQAENQNTNEAANTLFSDANYAEREAAFKGVNSKKLLIEKMSTNCDCASNIPNFCLLQGKAFGDAPKDKDSAIEVYTYCINETKKCLCFTENPVSKEKLCKQIAIGYNERGFMRYQKVDFDDAIADYSKALSYDASLYFTFYNRGLIHYRLGRFDKAISDMREALSLHPEFEPAKQCLAQANEDKLKPKQTENVDTAHHQSLLHHDPSTSTAVSDSVSRQQNKSETQKHDT